MFVTILFFTASPLAALMKGDGFLESAFTFFKVSKARLLFSFAINPAPCLISYYSPQNSAVWPSGIRSLLKFCWKFWAFLCNRLRIIFRWWSQSLHSRRYHWYLCAGKSSSNYSLVFRMIYRQRLICFSSSGFPASFSLLFSIAFLSYLRVFQSATRTYAPSLYWWWLIENIPFPPSCGHRSNCSNTKVRRHSWSRKQVKHHSSQFGGFSEAIRWPCWFICRLCHDPPFGTTLRTCWNGLWQLDARIRDQLKYRCCGIFPPLFNEPGANDRD